MRVEQAPSLIRYATAALSVTLALLVTVVMWPLVKPMASPLFLAAIVISAWIGGKGPGALATILSGLAIDFVFIPPQFQLSGGWDDISRLIVFAIEGLMLSGPIPLRIELHESHHRLVCRTSEEGAQLEQSVITECGLLAFGRNSFALHDY